MTYREPDKSHPMGTVLTVLDEEEKNMESTVTQFFGQYSTYLLSALVAAGLFFIMVGMRELNVHHTDGLLYIFLGAFFFGAHFLLLYNLPENSGITIGSAQNLIVVWSWLNSVFAPALIALFLLLGLFNFIATHIKIGLTKIFFGLSLPAFLYWLGSTWSLDIRGILTLVWTMIWFDVELETEEA
jgi:hypothetical protein